MTGLVLQLAIGPVFIFIANISLQSGLMHGLAAVLAVTVVDYFYIALAILGIGRVLEAKVAKGVLTCISSFVLIFFGFLMIRRGCFSAFTGNSGLIMNYSAAKSFLSAFALTISSPLTIVFWTGIFTARAEEYSLGRRELPVFAFSAGLATFIFLGLSVIVFSSVKVMVPVEVIQGLNILVGVILIGYGLTRIKFFRVNE